MSSDARFSLRDATSDLHRRIDAAFAGFDLGQPSDYRRFLTVHGRVVPALETAATTFGGWSGWSPRTPLLLADLEELGVQATEPMPPFPVRDAAEGWGVQYVLEGSRLGGALLARQVAPDSPRRYLSAAHGGGSWRAFQDELNAAAEAGGAEWLDRAVGGAGAAFARFEQALAL